jgi:predicted Zn-ribbon and HTH transcriptional regulator
MKVKAKEPTIPVERYDTIRRKIAALLSEREMGARDLSAELRIPEREIYDHLEHVRRSAGKGGCHFHDSGQM